MSKEAAVALLTGEPVAPIQGVTEVTTDKPAEAVAGTVLDSDRFAKLAAKEASLQKDRENFKTEQQKVYEREGKLRAIEKQILDFEEMRSKDPIQALKILGFTDTDVFNALAGNEKPAATPEEIARLATQDELKKYEQAQLQAQAKVQAERDTKAIAGYKDAIGKVIEKQADKYEYCNFYGPVAQDLVYETVLQIMEDEQKAGSAITTPMDAMREAIELVEGFYEEDDKSRMSLKKRQPKVEATAPAPTPPPQRTRSVSTPAAKPVPTLTNKTTATVSSQANGRETSSQKRTRLENMLRGGLKQ